MIDTPITSKFFKKLEHYLELRRQDKRAKNSSQGKKIWDMEKAILSWAVGGHWHLGTPLIPKYLQDRLREKGFNEEDIKDIRKVSQNLVAHGFAYNLEPRNHDDIIQLTTEGFLMGEIIEEDNWRHNFFYEFIRYGILVIFFLTIIFTLCSLWLKIIEPIIKQWLI